MNHPSRSEQCVFGDREFDIFLVGVGGQGVLTMGDLIAEAAMVQDLPVNVYPAKGMAQRGGTVTVQVRLGRDVVGPQMPERAADLVVGLERSEALKAVQYVKPGGDFVLYGHVWEPTKVMLGEVAYPSLDQVKEKIREARARLHYVDPAGVPRRDGARLSANIYVLGAAAGCSGLGRVVDPDVLRQVVVSRWERFASVNEEAFQAGLEVGADAE